MKITDAANLIQSGYDRALGGQLAAPALDQGGVEAYLLTDGTLVIPGTNDHSDWRRNLTFGRVDRGASGTSWHKGFLQHASPIYVYAKQHNVRLVIGHSLGAAAAQIVAISLGLPAIAFACPPPLRGKLLLAGENRILTINRHDDTVAKPFLLFSGFRQVGRQHWIHPRERQSRGSHSIPAYLRAMEIGRASPPIPASWGH